VAGVEPLRKGVEQFRLADAAATEEDGDTLLVRADEGVQPFEIPGPPNQCICVVEEFGPVEQRAEECLCGREGAGG